MTQRLIAIGTSLGGTAALQVLLPTIPPHWTAAVALVFHRAQGASDTLERFLRKYSPLPVEEAHDKTPIQAGYLYYAPADYHLMCEENHFALTTEATVSYARPSIDVLFESVAEMYGERAAGVLLSGAGHDGAAGLVAIKQRGGLTVVQTPESAECASMPNAAIATGKIDKMLSLQEIVPFLLNWHNRG